MPLNIRTYHDLTEPDASGLLQQVVAQRGRVAARLADVGRVVAVMSGKGGVGKSFVTAHLARACGRAGRAVGVLDADLNGPTAARLLDAPRIPLTVRDDAVLPAVAADGVRLISMAQLLEDGQPLAFRGPEAETFIWRGAQEVAALREFLSDIAWGKLDLLLHRSPARNRALRGARQPPAHAACCAYRDDPYPRVQGRGATRAPGGGRAWRSRDRHR